MIPKKAITRAKKAGYEPIYEMVGRDGEYDQYNEPAIALDPSFWQCLYGCYGFRTRTAASDEIAVLTGVELTRLILTGGDITRFWNELLK
jgi:hypothetical protein